MISRQPIPYYGGKVRMLDIILPLFDAVNHRTYAELFAGGASPYFAKKKSPVELINDINTNIANLYRVMKHPQKSEELCEMISGTLHCEATHEYANKIYHSNGRGYSSVKRAWATWTTANMSFSGQLGGHFRWTSNKADNWHPATSIHRRRSMMNDLCRRLETTAIMSRDAVKILQRIDMPELLVYLDPPYVGARQGHYEGYTQEHFDELLDTLDNMEGKFVMSSYANPRLTELVKKNGWTYEEHHMRLGVTSSVQEKTEILTFNFERPIIKKPQYIQLEIT